MLRDGHQQSRVRSCGRFRKDHLSFWVRVWMAYGPFAGPQLPIESICQYPKADEDDEVVKSVSVSGPSRKSLLTRAIIQLFDLSYHQAQHKSWPVLCKRLDYTTTNPFDAVY